MGKGLRAGREHVWKTNLPGSFSNLRSYLSCKQECQSATSWTTFLNLSRFSSDNPYLIQTDFWLLHFTTKSKGSLRCWPEIPILWRQVIALIPYTCQSNFPTHLSPLPTPNLVPKFPLSWNPILKVTSRYFCYILLIRSNPLDLVLTQGEMITQEHTYKEFGLIGSHFRNTYHSHHIQLVQIPC